VAKVEGQGWLFSGEKVEDPVKPIIDSYTIRALIVGVVTLLGSFGVKWTLDDSQITKIVEGVLAFGTLASMVAAIYGRLRARQPLGNPVCNEPAAKPAPLVVTQQQIRDPSINTDPEPLQTVKVTDSDKDDRVFRR
jgi:hypothetical protein